MRTKITLFLLSICLLLTACGPAAQPEPAPDPDPVPEASAPEDPPAPEEPAQPELPKREREWLEDIEFLRESIKTRHMDPFYFCPEEDFDRALDRLSAKVGELSDSDIFYELSAIVYSLGDSHTVLYWMDPYPIFDRYFPIWVFPYDGKLYMTCYMEGYEQFEPYLMHEVVAVNGVNALYLQEKAASLEVPFSWASREYSYFYPTFLDWAGCDYKEGYTVQILNENQEVVSLELPEITGEQWNQSKWVYCEGWESLAFVYADNRTVYVEGENGGCIQWCINTLASPSNLERFLGDIRELEEAHPDCGKVVVDLRSCPGGFSDFEPLAAVLRQGADALEGKQVYVLTGGKTASASTKLIAYMKAEHNAVLAGEPTGQFSSFFSRTTGNDVRLPNSFIPLLISGRWRDSAALLEEWDIDYEYEEYYDADGKVYEWETTILPDVYVHQAAEDILQGKDSVIEWVLRQA